MRVQPGLQTPSDDVGNGGGGRSSGEFVEAVPTTALSVTSSCVRFTRRLGFCNPRCDARAPSPKRSSRAAGSALLERGNEDGARFALQEPNEGGLGSPSAPHRTRTTSRPLLQEATQDEHERLHHSDAIEDVVYRNGKFDHVDDSDKTVMTLKRRCHVSMNLRVWYENHPA